MNDLISRQAAIDAMSVLNDSTCEQQAIDALCELPSAERRGKWIPKDERWRCTLCDGIAPKGIRWNYCPNCGAKMITDKDDTQ